MNDFVPFTYDAPTENDAPLWVAGTPRDTRVAIIWRPTIACSAHQFQIGRSLTVAPGIPWNDLNLAEIRVESRKAYEVLSRLIPAGQNLFIRINPPSPGSWAGDVIKKRSVTIFTNGLPIEFALSALIAKGLSVHNIVVASGDDYDLIQETQVAVFCHRTQADLNHLRFALRASCLVVSSDAGAAEEYLSMQAPPRSWHVAKTWEPREWLNMIRELLCEHNEVYQSSAVDQTPYITAWGNA